jgi:penicillin-binding protein 2
VSVGIERIRPASRNLYRFGTFVLAIVVVVAALGVRMFQLQLIEGGASYPVTQGDSSETRAVPSSRGLIFDSNDTPLVKNIPNFTIQVIPHDLPLSEKAVVVRQLASLLKLDPLVIDGEIDSATGSLYNPVVIAIGVPTDVARMVDENHDVLPGVQVVAEPLREYTNGPLFGEILGYTGSLNADDYANLKEAGYTSQDIIGKAGLEQKYESVLRGTYGKESVALDSNGLPISGLATQISPPIPGSSLTLSLNTRDQALAQKALQWGISAAGVKMGVIIVENPQTGEILAMVSLPGYDDNLFAQGLSQKDYQALRDDPSAPLINKAVSEQYAPGSTYKLVTGTAGLQEGVITATTTIDSVPYIELGAFKTKYKEWNGIGWGPLNIIMGLAHSSDTFFYQLAQKVGLPALTYWADQYGFGAKTGVDLPGETTGIVPTNEWKTFAKGEPMYDGDIVQVGIGQGFVTSTPLQLLNAYCALANGGNLWQPHLVTKITDPNGNVTEIQPNLIRKLPASAQTLQTMRDGLRAVITSRHTYTMVDLPIKVAGKTGTAEFGTQDKYGRLPYHEWFVGYTPADAFNGDPTGTTSQLAVLSFVYGADTYGDISTEIVKYFMWMHYNLKGSPFNQKVPGYIPYWVPKRTNFYGTANNH